MDKEEVHFRIRVPAKMGKAIRVGAAEGYRSVNAQFMLILEDSQHIKKLMSGSSTAARKSKSEGASK